MSYYRTGPRRKALWERTPAERARRRDQAERQARAAMVSAARIRTPAIARQAERQLNESLRARGQNVSPDCLGCGRPVAEGAHCSSCGLRQMEVSA